MTKKLIIPILIITLGLSLRIWKVDEIPPAVNRDEAAIGYTAYSILKTNRDEYGVLLPLSIKSFGDWKLPLYIYLDMIPVKLFNLDEFSVRLPSIIFGTLTLPIFYLLILELFKKYNYKDSIALLGTLFLSISPWHIHFSRVTSEANVAVFLVVSALYLFFSGLGNNYLLFISSIFFALSLYTYHGNHVFSVMLFFILLLTLTKVKNKKNSAFLFILPFILLGSLIFKETLFSADKTKFSGLSPLSNKFLVYDRVNTSRLEHKKTDSFFAKILHNRPTLYIENFLEGYLKSFSPEFLLHKGGGNLQHNIPNFGNLYLVESIFMILGIYFMFYRRYQWRWLLLLWLLTSPIPAALTRDAPHSARMLAILPLPHLLSALGLVEILRLINKKRSKSLFIFILSALFGINMLVYLDRYFVHFPIKAEYAWGGGYKELVDEVSLLSDQYNEIWMDRPNYSPYIYFLFYKRLDPEKFQREVERYGEDLEGFQHVKSLNKLTFKYIDWSEDIALPNKSPGKKLLISWVESTPAIATQSGLIVTELSLKLIEKKFGTTLGLEIGDIVENRLLKTIKLKNGTPQFYLIELNDLKKRKLTYD